MTYDRNAYRNYLKSKPFHGIDVAAESSTPKSSMKAIPTYEELHTSTAESSSSGSKESPNGIGIGDGDGHDQTTPTKAGKGKGKGVERTTTMNEDMEAWSSRAN